MEPIGPLMIEHRLIENMINFLDEDVVNQTNNKHKQIDPKSIERIIDFFIFYGDKLHHEKEEKLLFKKLIKKDISEDHQKTLDKILKEHDEARQLFSKIKDQNKLYRDGYEKESAKIEKNLKEVIKLYRKHVEREDNNFFIQIMDYFDEPEKDDMFKEMMKFNRNYINQMYEEKLEYLKQSKD